MSGAAEAVDAARTNTTGERRYLIAVSGAASDAAQKTGDAGNGGACRFSADDASLVFGFDCFACDNDRLDVTWSGVALRSGH